MMSSSLARLQLKSDDPEQLNDVAKKIISFAGDERVWIFEGDMGAGKTTLIKAICKEFNIEDNVTSPTFSIVNEYRNADDEPFYHFDFYRIEDEEEAAAIGTDEYFYSGNYCFIEWPSKVSALLPDHILTIELSIEDTNKRLIDLAKYD